MNVHEMFKEHDLDDDLRIAAQEVVFNISEGAMDNLYHHASTAENETEGTKDDRISGEIEPCGEIVVLEAEWSDAEDSREEEYHTSSEDADEVDGIEEATGGMDASEEVLVADTVSSIMNASQSEDSREHSIAASHEVDDNENFETPNGTPGGIIGSEDPSDKMGTDLRQLVKENETLKEQLAAREQELAATEQIVQTAQFLKKRSVTLEKVIEELRSALGRTAVSYEQARTELDAALEVAATLEKMNGDLRKALDEKDVMIGDLQGIISDYTATSTLTHSVIMTPLLASESFRKLQIRSEHALAASTMA